MTPGAGLVLTPGAFYERTWKRSTRRMPHNKYQISTPSSFREKKKLKMGFFVPMFQLVTPRVGPVMTPGHHMNRLGRGPQGDAMYQISKLLAFQFQRRRILKFSSFVPMFQTCDPRGRPSFDPMGII